MKRIMYLSLMVLIGAGTLSAQQWGGCGMLGWGRGPRSGSRSGPQSGPSRSNTRNENRETATVTGKLELINGQIALKQGETTYYAAGLQRLIGFVDGLKEGAEVTLEGFVLAYPGTGENRNLLVSKLTLNGKEYDNLLPASPSRPNPPAQPNQPPQPRQPNQPNPPNQPGMRQNRYNYQYLPPKE